MTVSSVRRWPRRRHHPRGSTLPQCVLLSILQGGLPMVDDAVGGGGEMRMRSLDAGDRPRVCNLG